MNASTANGARRIFLFEDSKPNLRQWFSRVFQNLAIHRGATFVASSLKKYGKEFPVQGTLLLFSWQLPSISNLGVHLPTIYSDVLGMHT